ncbi:conserved protein of unknown function [Bacillus velezensis UCMB5033]|nr:conserved protein of unknown function [Bacillus velezensis UCMB5033]
MSLFNPHQSSIENMQQQINELNEAVAELTRLLDTKADKNQFGSKQIDESKISDGKVLVYNASTGKLEYGKIKKSLLGDISIDLL